MTETEFLKIYDQFKKAQKRRDRENTIIMILMGLSTFVVLLPLFNLMRDVAQSFAWLCLGIGLVSFLAIVLYQKFKYVDSVDALAKQVSEHYSIGEVLKQYYQIKLNLDQRKNSIADLDLDDSAVAITQQIEANQKATILAQQLHDQKFEYMYMVATLWPGSMQYLEM